MFFKFTFQTEHKIATIRVLRSAAQHEPLDDNHAWSLKFTKDVVEGGIITQSAAETSIFLTILVEAKKAIKDFAADFTWIVEEYKPITQPVFFCNRN